MELDDDITPSQPDEHRPRVSTHQPSPESLRLMEEASRSGPADITADDLRKLADGD